MTVAILIIDIVNDTLKRDTHLSRTIRSFLPDLNQFLNQARQAGYKIVFSTDSYRASDPLFQGGIKPYSVEGTRGAEVACEIIQSSEDVWLPKRRWSAFFMTDLDKKLRQWGVTKVAVAGVTTHYCVLSTAMDAFAHDFKTIILKDFCASFSEEIHHTTLDNLKVEIIDPWFRIMSAKEFWVNMENERG